MFIPKTGNAGVSNLDEIMRAALAESLLRLGVRAARHLPPQPTPESLALAIRQNRVAPGVFARYYALIDALQSGQPAKASSLWSDIGSLVTQTPPFRVVACAYETLGDDVSRYAEVFGRGQRVQPIFLPPPPALCAAVRERIEEALALLTRVQPAWAQEIQSLVGEIILLLPQNLHLSGGSSMMLWGTVLLNAEMATDRIAALMTLAHEATHLMLFGVACREPLARNPPEETFSTALRPTPRPMSALFHATYVSGRLHALAQHLLASPELTREEQDTLAALATLQRERFRQGVEIVLAQGLLSAAARELMEEARALTG
jgi:hypothetical protein